MKKMTWALLTIITILVLKFCYRGASLDKCPEHLLVPPLATQLKSWWYAYQNVKETIECLMYISIRSIAYNLKNGLKETLMISPHMLLGQFFNQLKPTNSIMKQQILHSQVSRKSENSQVAWFPYWVVSLVKSCIAQQYILISVEFLHC